MHISLPEKVDIITIDAGWTKLEKVIPSAIQNLKTSGLIIALLKPHYEKGEYIKDFEVEKIVASVVDKISQLDIKVISKVESPLLGLKGGNKEFLLLLKPK